MAGRAPKIGLVLGSGGARGWSHLGVLRGLDEIGVVPDVIVGCSMGALVGVAEAGGQRGALEAWARDLTQTSFLSLVDVRLSSGGLVAGRQLANVLSEFGLDRDIESLDRRFVAIATDLATGREVWLQEGPILPAIRASVGIPGLFSPQEIDGRWLVDGGLINPVPISVCIALGVDVAIAVNPNAKPNNRYWTPAPAAEGMLAQWDRALRTHLPAQWRPAEKDAPPAPGPNGMDVVNATVDILTEHLRRNREASAPADVMIDVDLQDFPLLAFYEADTAIAAGYEALQAHRDQIIGLCRPG